jgi:diguanylate cyclase (GGDEF)-like protein
VASLAAAQPLAKRLDSPRRDVQYHEAAAEVHSRLDDWKAAFNELRALRESERRAAQAANQKSTQELQARFGAKQRETEYELLRAESNVAEARRLLLLLALALAAVVVIALTVYVMRQARQSRRFAALAMRDDLTGLPNRRSILEFARLQFRGRRAADTGFVLALMDIDHFKSVNDQFGHSVGDEVLKAFAQAGLKALRAEDRLGRFGGEEFVLVMPGFDLARVPAVFQRLRESVQRLEAPGWPGDRALTFSMGATMARDTDPDLDEVIKRADEALYRAKNNGRDRYEAA